MVRPKRTIVQTLFLPLFLLCASASGFSQFAYRPIADPSDRRFDGVTEDFSTPGLSSSHLIPVPPLSFITQHDGYSVELIRVQWRWGDPIDLYLIKPAGIKKPPVIVNLYGYPADTDAYKNEIFQKALVEDGFAAVGFVSALTGHRYHDRPMREWFLSDLQEALATSAHDAQMMVNYLETRNDLDMSHVGMFGQGSGATIAILASSSDPRIKALDILDPWGDWPVWLSLSPFVPEDERADYIKPEFLKKAATLETIDWLPRVQAKKLRLQQLAFETDTPQPAKEKIRASVPVGATTLLYKTLPEFKTAFPNSTNLEWIRHQLRSLQ